MFLSCSVSVKELTTILQPSAASAWAIASPMPEVEPVTIAVLLLAMIDALSREGACFRYIASQQICEAFAAMQGRLSRFLGTVCAGANSASWMAAKQR
jgi:hypothetical protein